MSVIRKGFFPARISIGNWHGEGNAQPIRIEIENAKTGKMVAEVRMSLEAFSEAITGVGHREAIARKFPVRG